jgi:hypothetical protein
MQVSLKTGLVNGIYSNPVPVENDGGGNVKSELEGGGFMVVPSFDLEVEVFDNSKKSYLARTIIALDLADGKMKYNYLGVGMRTYFKGVGISRSFITEKTRIRTIPKRRMYYGFDLGFSRVSVVSFGSVLSAVSTGIDFGGHGGYIKQLNENWGISAQFGMSYAFGISTVSASGINIKVLSGLTYTIPE